MFIRSIFWNEKITYSQKTYIIIKQAIKLSSTQYAIGLPGILSKLFCLIKYLFLSLIQLEYSAFSEATVPICTFVLSNFDENYAGTYLKLSEFTGGMDVQKEKVLQIISGDEILNDSYFLKRWFELNFNKISFNSTETFQEPLK